MGYHTSNAAYAYDMQPSAAPYAPAPSAAPERGRNFDVVTGQGREADQETSPAFRYCIKIFCVLAAVFVAVGMLRVALASATAGIMNTNAELTSELEDVQDESSDLEVMYSVYGSTSRIRELAEGYGMVEAEDSLTLDFTEYVVVDDGAEDESAEEASVATASDTVDGTDAAEAGSEDVDTDVAATEASTSVTGSVAATTGSASTSDSSQPDDVVTIVEDSAQ